MDQNVKRHIQDGLLTYRSQLSRLRETRKRLPKNKRELERTLRERRIGKEDSQKGGRDRDGEVVLAFAEGVVEEKGANEDADIENAKPIFKILCI